jgi:hypothetical protein
MKRALGYAAKCLLLAAGYFGAVKGGLAFAVVHDFISLISPATGLALVALTLMGLRFFPALVAGGLAVTRCTGCRSRPRQRSRRGTRSRRLRAHGSSTARAILTRRWAGSATCSG